MRKNNGIESMQEEGLKIIAQWMITTSFTRDIWRIMLHWIVLNGN
ncbi:MAG: hypothetical protein ABF418_07920 [Liquorilactobacillus sp.]